MVYTSLLDKYPIFEIVHKVSSELSYDTYVIGGFVRDYFLNRVSIDIDFVTTGDGTYLAKVISKKMDGSKLVVYKNFGTAHISYHNYDFEFVGTRKESYNKDSRNPIVESGSLSDDQKRRDFTINSMAFGLSDNNFGQLIDPFDGMSDLKNKIIRTPIDENKTFDDDPLRMMRAIRFATQLNFDIEPNTYQGIINNVQRIHIVSVERIRDELNKIIMAKNPSYGFKLLFNTGLLHEIFPDMVKLYGVETKLGKSHKDNFYHTLKVLDNVSNLSDSLWIRWAAILHDIAKPITKRFDRKIGWTFHGHEDKGARMVPKIFKQLRLPLNDKMLYVKKLVKLHLRPISLIKDNVTDTAIRRLIFEAGDDLEDLMKLCKADITSKNNERVKKYLLNFEKVENKIKLVEDNDRLRNFEPPISGSDIMRLLDIPQGRLVGIIKNEIREAILEGIIKNDKIEAKEFMFQIATRNGMKIVCNNK